MNSLNLLSGHLMLMGVYKLKLMPFFGHTVFTKGHHSVFMIWRQGPGNIFQLQSSSNVLRHWHVIYYNRLPCTNSNLFYHFLLRPLSGRVQLRTSFHWKTETTLMTIWCDTKCFIKYLKCHGQLLSRRYSWLKTVRLFILIFLSIIHFPLTACWNLWITINHYVNSMQRITACSQKNDRVTPAAFKYVMTNASYIDVDPLSCISFVNIRNINNLGVLRFVFIFIGREIANWNRLMPLFFEQTVP